jgi:hypothetical protein
MRTKTPTFRWTARSMSQCFMEKPACSPVAKATCKLRSTAILTLFNVVTRSGLGSDYTQIWRRHREVKCTLRVKYEVKGVTVVRPTVARAILASNLPALSYA